MTATVLFVCPHGAGKSRIAAAWFAVVATVMVFGLRWPVLRTLGACAVLGLAAGLTGLPVT